MDLRISKYRIYLHQFSNIVLGASIIVLLLSLNAASMGWGEWAKQVFIFLVAFGTIFHAWWRNAELFTTSKAKTAGVYIIGVLRIVLILLSLFLLRSITAIPNPLILQYQVLFGMLAITLWIGLSQQIIFLRPLYGKVRVMQKREYLTDLFYALSMTLYAIGLMILPEITFSLIGYGVVAMCIAISRPVAKTSTPWTEPAPPHRGGRSRRERPQYGGSRSGGGYSNSRSAERDPRERRPGTPVQNRDRSRARSERPMVRSNRNRPEYKKKTAPSYRTESGRETLPESPRVIRGSDANRDESVEKKKRVDEPPEYEGKKYGRRRRGRKRVVEQQKNQVEQKDASPAGENALENASSKELTVSVSAGTPEKKDDLKTKYGRKKVKASSVAGQLEEKENGADAPKKSHDKPADKTVRQREMS